MTDSSEKRQVSSKYASLCSRLRQRLITVPKPGAQAFKPTYPISYTHTAGTVHKPGDSAGYVSFNPTINACAAGYDPNNVMTIEHIFVVDPLMEEAARALESIGNEPPGIETGRAEALEYLAEARRYIECDPIAEERGVIERFDTAVAALSRSPETEAQLEPTREHLQKLVQRTADHWLSLQLTHTIAWEGAIDAAMEAACNEIRRLDPNAQKASERQPCSHGNATGHCQHCLDAL